MKYQLEELSIELSARCACRCIMCSSGSTPKALPNELDEVEVRYLIKQARDMGATILSFSGGDPLLQREYVPGYIVEALSLGYEQILFYTTGIGESFNTMVDVPCAKRWVAHPGDAMIEFLDELGNDMVTYLPESLRDKNKIVFVFSLHSHIATTHNYIMGLSNAWETTVHYIQLISRCGYKVWTHMVPMLPNWQDAPKLRQLCCELGVEKMSMLRYVPQTRGRANRRKLELNVDEFRAMQETMVGMLGQILPYTKLRLGCPIDFRHTIDPSMDDKAKPCHAGTDLMLVRPQGDVHPCAAWKTLPDDSNVRDKSLIEIWETGHIFQAIRHFREDGWMELGGPCSICKYLGSCKGGCPAQKLHWLGIHGYGPDIGHITWPIADPLCPINGVGPSGYVQIKG